MMITMQIRFIFIIWLKYNYNIPLFYSILKISFYFKCLIKYTRSELLWILVHELTMNSHWTHYGLNYHDLDLKGDIGLCNFPWSLPWNNKFPPRAFHTHVWFWNKSYFQISYGHNSLEINQTMRKSCLSNCNLVLSNTFKL